MRTYDDWKTMSPEDELDLGEPPEEIETCENCGGEGCIEVYDDGFSRWSIDPPCGRVVCCPVCNGQGQFICERTPDYEH